MHTIALRVPDDVARQVEEVSKKLQRTKSFIIRKAIEVYIHEYVDYQIALDRLNDKDDEIISAKKMRSLSE